MWLADSQFVLPNNWTGVANKVAGDSECMCVYCEYLLCICKYTHIHVYIKENMLDLYIKY